MNISHVMREVAEVLDSALPKTQVTWFWSDKVAPPQLVIGLPEMIDFDTTYGRGCDSVSGLEIIAVVGKVNTSASFTRLAEYSAGSGASSVKQIVESHTGVSYMTLSVDSVEFGSVSVGGVDYLTAVFSLTITGKGE